MSDGAETPVSRYASTRLLRWHQRFRRDQFGDPDQRIAADRQGRQKAHISQTAELHLAQWPSFFGPTEAFFDTFADALTDAVALVPGRSRMYEAIVKGEPYLEPGLPESFNVLVKELQSLGLDVELVKSKD